MLFELILAIALIVAMVRIADVENMSPWLWGAVAFLILLGSGIIPIPYFRILVAGILSYGAMLTYKIVANK